MHIALYTATLSQIQGFCTMSIKQTVAFKSRTDSQRSLDFTIVLSLYVDCVADIFLESLEYSRDGAGLIGWLLLVDILKTEKNNIFFFLYLNCIMLF